MLDQIDVSGFWNTATAACTKAGEGLMLEAMKAWHVAQDPATPSQAKALLFGALAYFVLPTDAIPDIVPIVGFSVVMAALGAALYAANAHLTPEILARAKASVSAVFG